MRKLILIGALFVASLNVLANSCETDHPYPNLTGAHAYANFWENFDASPTVGFAISFWFKPLEDVIDGDGRKYLVKDTKKRWVFWEEDGEVYYAYGSMGTVITHKMPRYTNPIAKDKWYFVAVSEDPMDQSAVYFDEGAGIGPNSESLGLSKPSSAVWPTTEYPATTFAKTGAFALDEVRFFKDGLDFYNGEAANLPHPCLIRAGELSYSDPTLPASKSGKLMISTNDMTFTRTVPPMSQNDFEDANAYPANWWDMEDGDFNTGYLSIANGKLNLSVVPNTNGLVIMNFESGTATSATLTFDYEFVGASGATSEIWVEISNNYGASYTSLMPLLPTGDGSYNVDISQYIGGYIQIQFMTVGWVDITSRVEIDNFKVE